VYAIHRHSYEISIDPNLLLNDDFEVAEEISDKNGTDIPRYGSHCETANPTVCKYS
jgi:hypothetical protein